MPERKNYHLLETVRAIIFTNSMPNSYWGEAILTASYLINWIPSKVLAFKTLLSVLLEFYPHHTRILNSFPPKVFECTVSVHKYQPSHSKLEPKALKCMFVGYSLTQQGYKCYCPSTRQFIVSCDVSFLKHQPFFPHIPLQGGTPSVEQYWGPHHLSSYLFTPYLSFHWTTYWNSSCSYPKLGTLSKGI